MALLGDSRIGGRRRQGWRSGGVSVGPAVDVVAEVEPHAASTTANTERDRFMGSERQGTTDRPAG